MLRGNKINVKILCVFLFKLNDLIFNQTSDDFHIGSIIYKQNYKHFLICENSPIHDSTIIYRENFAIIYTEKLFSI